MIPKTDGPAIRRALLRWHRRHAQPAPWRDSRDPYHALVAAVMAQQTQMSRVLPKYEQFVTAFPTVEALADATPGDVLRAWAPLGYNMRALRLHRAAQRIVQEGASPRAAADLERLDGIGAFTAAIVASFAFGEPIAAVDTNVQRIVGRLLCVTGDEARRAAGDLLSRGAAARWNQAMMDLGALVCTARAPKCDVCPLHRWCRSRGTADGTQSRIAEPRTAYPAQLPFKHSRRYYRGKIVDALRRLPPNSSISSRGLFEQLPDRNGLDRRSFAALIATLERDGLVRTTPSGRVRLP